MTVGPAPMVGRLRRVDANLDMMVRPILAFSDPPDG
jgi:hypothetical protein